MNNAIVLMVSFLKSVNYDIEFNDNCMTIVKHKDDPWNHFNKFIAKPDGVYNYATCTLTLEFDLDGVKQTVVYNLSSLTTQTFDSYTVEPEDGLNREVTVTIKLKSTGDKEKFIEKIWGYDSNAEYNTIEVYVSFLRKKLTAVGAKTEIKSLRGIGYTLE